MVLMIILYHKNNHKNSREKQKPFSHLSRTYPFTALGDQILLYKVKFVLKCTNINQEFRPLMNLIKHLTARADDSHATPV